MEQNVRAIYRGQIWGRYSWRVDGGWFGLADCVIKCLSSSLIHRECVLRVKRKLIICSLLVILVSNGPGLWWSVVYCIAGVGMILLIIIGHEEVFQFQ